VIAVRERPHGHRDLLSREIELRVIGHVADKASRSKEKVGRCIPAASRSGPIFPVGEVPWMEPGDSVFRETVELHPARFAGEVIGPSRRVRGSISGDDRLGASAPLGLLEQLYVPGFHEAVVRIELQIPVLAVPQAHDLGPCPARTLALTPAHSDHLNPAVGEAARRWIGLIMLPTNARPQTVRKARFGQAVFYCRAELRIPICSDRDEDEGLAGVAFRLAASAPWRPGLRAENGRFVSHLAGASG